MELIQINENGPMINGLAELNHHIRDEHKEVRDGITGEGQGLSEEDESGINEDVELVNDASIEAFQAQAHVQAGQGPQPQAQLPLVCWERFLPHRSLKVLLVENDDSTCRIVCALLRNCGYEVVAVENGLEAWKVLENLTDQIDLILTEVVMPCLSGIGLLRKIMSHKTCKKIPVIMMSSHDSMSIVLRCLSKGAVYFLVKPIRKNELQNLWQHVWRKFHSSSGSGSESGIMTQKSTKSKSAEESDNNSGCNDEDDIGSIGLNVHDGSDNGSGTQSSWTKKAVEVESPKPMSPWDKLTDPRDSTCAQVIIPRPEAFGDSWLPMTATGDCKEQHDELDHVAMGKDLEIGAPRIPNWQLQDPTGKELNNIASINDEKLSEMNPKKDDEQKDKKELELNGKKLNGDFRNQAADPAGVITNSIHSPIGSVVLGISNGLLKVSGMKEKTIYENNEIPSLELSLKRQRDTRDTESGLHERNILRHLDEHSAFSRYTSASTASQALTGNVDSNSPVDNSSEAAKTEAIQNFQSNPNGTPPSQQSNGSSNNNEIGLTTNSAFTKWTVCCDKPTLKSMIKCLHPSSQPVQNVHKSPQPTVQGKADAAVANTILAQARGMDQQVQVQHHHHHYHHYHHHVRNMLQQQLANHDDLLLKTMAAAAPQCASYNDLNAPTEGNSSNHSLNGSTSGSNYGSNGQNWSSTAVNARGTNTESDNKLTANSGAGGGIGYGSRRGVDQNRSAQREAALNKFRQKRKERSFEKKVRYHSRKKLAEQRPRIRGQFVRRVVLENKDENTETHIS